MEPRRKVFVGVGHLTHHKEFDAAATKKLRRAYPQIVHVLDESGIPWLWFSGLRIGYSDETAPDAFPLVLYLNVAFHTGFAKALPVAMAVRDVLARQGLPEVHVEVRENLMELHAASAEAERLTEGLHVPGGLYHREIPWKSLWDYDDALSWGASTLGWEIAAGKSAPRFGTAGPFITFREWPGELFTTAAYHVICAPASADSSKQRVDPVNSLGGNKYGTAESDSNTRLQVVQAHDDTIREALQDTQASLSAREDLTDEAKPYFKHLERVEKELLTLQKQD